MTHNLSNQGPKIALFEPDIPQNTAAIIRTCSCLGAKLEIIEPCGFLLSDKRFKRVVMDYMDENQIRFYQSSKDFLDSKKIIVNAEWAKSENNIPARRYVGPKRFLIGKILIELEPVYAL